MDQKKVLIISGAVLVIVLIVAVGIARMQKNDSQTSSAQGEMMQKNVVQDSAGVDATDPLSAEGLSADLESEMDAALEDQDAAAEFMNESDVDALDSIGGEAEQL